MSPITVVGIAGITGKFARLLASCLIEKSSEVKIKGLARDPSKLDASISSSPKVEIFKGDAFDTKNVRPFVHGCDIVVCCYLGDDNLMIEGQKILIDLAEEENVPRYVASDWSLDWTKLERGELFAKEACQVVKAYLESKEGIEGVHILIGGFTDVIFAPFFGIWDSENRTFSYWGSGREVWECTTYLNSAQYTAAVCLDREVTGVLRFAGDIISIPDMAKCFEKAYNTKPRLKRLGSLDDLHTKMLQERKKYGSDFYKYVFYFYHYFTLSGKALMGTHDDNQKYPEIKLCTVEDFMKSTSIEGLGGAHFPWESKTIEGGFTHPSRLKGL